MEAYFSDAFKVSAKALQTYGAFNISLVSDLPLFIDPFLLFNSKNPVYQGLHDSIIEYLTFLRDKAIAGKVDDGLLQSWYFFKEVKQNWLGFTYLGNNGRALGLDFAQSLHNCVSSGHVQGMIRDMCKASRLRCPHVEAAADRLVDHRPASEPG